MTKSDMENPVHQTQLPKVGDLVARRLVVRIFYAALSAMAVLALGIGAFSGIAQVNSIERDAKALAGQLARSMQFFDYAPTTGMLNAFTRGRDLVGAVVFDREGQVVASNLRDISSVNSHLSANSSDARSAFWLSFDHGRPRAWIETAVATPADLPLGSLIIAIPFGVVLKYVAMAVGGFGLFMMLLLVWLAHTARVEVAKSLDSIGKLTAAFNQVASLREWPQAKITPDSIEVKALVDAYEQMITTLRQAGDKEADHQRALAVAQTTQMLAHDVRKPFSILTMGLKSLSMAADADHIRHLVDRMVPEVDRALTSVNGMIADIMEIGSTSTDALNEPVSPQALLEASLADLFRLFPNANVALSYQLGHTNMVDIDSQKVLRVFMNILSNALQAMSQEGSLWFRTRDKEEDGQSFVEFCLGNDGPPIAPENLSRLFDAFFTRGKRGGTGLGLAIVQKVIKAHGGRIECLSRAIPDSARGEVEFWFTLPVLTHTSNRTTASLPASSEDFAKALASLKPLQNMVSTSINRSERELETLVADMSHKLARPLRVLVVDDEAIYRNALSAFFVIGKSRETIVEISLSPGSGKALEYVRDKTFDLIISDVDLGPSSLDGFELVSAINELLAEQRRQALICIHSNRIIAADHRAAAECGAHAFLPKPMARAQLLRLLLQAGQAANSEGTHNRPEPKTAAEVEIIIIEDNVFVLEAWEAALSQHAVVHALTSPEAFDAKLAADPQILSRISCLVTDYYFDNSDRTGVDIGHLAKSQQPNLLVVLVTDGIIAKGELDGAIDRVIAKEDLDIKVLAS